MEQPRLLVAPVRLEDGGESLGGRAKLIGEPHARTFGESQLLRRKQRTPIKGKKVVREKLQRRERGVLRQLAF